MLFCLGLRIGVVPAFTEGCIHLALNAECRLAAEGSGALLERVRRAAEQRGFDPLGHPRGTAFPAGSGPARSRRRICI